MRAASIQPGRVVVIMPARNAARTLEATFKGIPGELAQDIVLVDNGSADDTVAIARRLGLRVVVHGFDRGYGGSLKTCLKTALGSGAERILELHPDNQYDPEAIPRLLAAAEDPRCGIAMGSRFLPPGRALEGGMPRWKYLSNRTLTRANRLLLGVNLSEFHSGYRVYRAECLRHIPFENNSDDFLFSFQILAQALRLGYEVREVPARSLYFEEASSNPFWGSVCYGTGTLWTSLQCFLDRAGLAHFELFSAADPSSPQRA